MTTKQENNRKGIEINLQQKREITNLGLILVFTAGVIIGAWLW